MARRTTLSDKDARGTMDWTLSTQTPKSAGIALENWGRRDNAAAAAWLKDHTDAEWYPGSLGTFAWNYFARSPFEAVDWATSLPAGKVRGDALGSLRRTVAGKNRLNADERTSLETRLGKP